MPANFPERCLATTTFDGTGNTLRQQQPPRDDVPVPCVDDDIHVLIEQIAFDDSNVHKSRLSGTEVAGNPVVISVV